MIRLTIEWTIAIVIRIIRGYPVYLVKRYIFTSRRLPSPCVFRLMSVFASAHRRKAQFLILIELCTCRDSVIYHQEVP